MTHSSTDIAWHGVLMEQDQTTLWPFAPGGSSGRPIPLGPTDPLPDGPKITAGNTSPAHTLPTPLMPDALITSGTDTHHLPALKQTQPFDLLASARVIAIGFQSLNPKWDGVLCLTGPDTTHWLHISASEAVSFQGFDTPRLAAHYGCTTTAPDTDAASATISRPERLAADLHTAALQSDHSAILGHLLGAEIAAARPYWLGQQVALLGTGPLTAAYSTLLTAQHVPHIQADTNRMIAQGFSSLAPSAGL